MIIQIMRQVRKPIIIRIRIIVEKKEVPVRRRVKLVLRY
jgi:hypothetical protein